MPKMVFIPKTVKNDPFHSKSSILVCLTSFVLQIVLGDYIRTNVRNGQLPCMLTDALRDAEDTFDNTSLILK